MESGLERRLKPTVGRTLMVINAIGHLAEVAWHHPDLVVSYAFVEVKLDTCHQGISQLDFDLAKKIDDFIFGIKRDNSPLEELLMIKICVC